METLSRDILPEIMLRMPLKSLFRCTSVSKKWKKIIRDEVCDKHFQDRYFRRSMTRPRLLFAFCQHKYPLDPGPEVLFHSVYQEENPLLSSGQQQIRILSDRKYVMISSPIRGLVCLQSRTKVVLCNPGTKKLLTLPECARKANSARKCFFGYDEVTDVFKVLLLDSDKSDEVMHIYHRVFTVGPGDNSWRPIVCEHRYIPNTGGLCIGGVLYYGAWSSERKPIVMSFNVRSEKFTVTELPEGVQFQVVTKLVNYNGKVALETGSGRDSFKNAEFQICVRDESAGIWRVEHVVIPRWRDIIAWGMLFAFEGTIETGELIFAIRSLHEGSHFVLYYNPVTQNLRKFKIKGVDGGSCQYAITFLNHFDSLLLT